MAPSGMLYVVSSALSHALKVAFPNILLASGIILRKSAPAYGGKHAFESGTKNKIMKSIPLGSSICANMHPFLHHGLHLELCKFLWKIIIRRALCPGRVRSCHRPSSQVPGCSLPTGGGILDGKSTASSSSKQQQQQNASVCRFKRVPVASDGSAQCGGVRGGQRCGAVNADLAVSVVGMDVG